MDIVDIKEKAISGSKWSIIEKFSLQIIQFIVGIILARLLGPEAFGLIALTSILITISGAVMDGGFEKALIQNQTLLPIQISTAFYINTLLGILMAAIICIAAPAIAVFKAPEFSSEAVMVTVTGPINWPFSCVFSLQICCSGLCTAVEDMIRIGKWNSH